MKRPSKVVTPATPRGYCLNCGMDTTFHVAADPALVDCDMLDCRGMERPVKIGFDVMICDICGGEGIDGESSRGVVERAQVRFLQTTLAQDVANFGDHVQHEIVSYCRRRLLSLVCLASLASIAIRSWRPELDGLALLIPLFGGTWTLYIGVASSKWFKRSVTHWQEQLSQELKRANSAPKGSK